MMPALLVVLALAEPDPSAPRERPSVEAPPCPEIDRSKSDNAYKLRVADSPFRRTGFALGVNVGAAGCDAGDFCRGRGFWAREATNPENPNERGTYATRPGVGPSVGLELGYRPIPYVEIDAFASFTYHPTRLDVPTFFGSGESFTFSAAGGVAVLGRPLAFSRFDPFLGLGFGFHTYRSTVDFTQGVGQRLVAGERIDRFMLRLSAGLDVFVARQVALGPRLDYSFFIAGQYCDTLEQEAADGSLMDMGRCNDISTLEDQVDPEGDSAEGTLPRFWRGLVQVRVYL